MKRRQKAKSRKIHKTKQNNTRRADKRGPGGSLHQHRMWAALYFGAISILSKSHIHEMNNIFVSTDNYLKECKILDSF